MIEFKIGLGSGEFGAMAEGLVLDYKVNLALINSNGQNAVQAVLNYKLMERLGHSIKKGDFLRVYSDISGSQAIIFRGIITDINGAPDGTTITVNALSMDYSLSTNAPAMIGAHSGLYQYLTLTKGQASLNGPWQPGPMVVYNPSGSDICPSGGYKEGVADWEYITNWGKGALIYIDSPAPLLNTDWVFSVPLAREPGTTGTTPAVNLELWEGLAIEGGQIKTFPRLGSKIASTTLNYDSLTEYNSSAPVQNFLRNLTYSGKLYSGRPYYLIISITDSNNTKKVYLANRAQDSDYRDMGLFVEYNSSGDINSYSPDGPAPMVRLTPCPPDKAADKSYYYDKATDKTILRIKGDSPPDGSYLFGPLIPANNTTTRDIIKRLVQLNNAFYAPTGYDSLNTRLDIGGIAGGAGLQQIKHIAALEGWDIWPSGFDPRGVMGGYAGNYYNISTLPIATAKSIYNGVDYDFYGNNGDILDMAIMPHVRPDPAARIKLKDSGAGDIVAPLFYDLIGSSGADFYPLMSDLPAAATDLRAIIDSISAALEYDLKGGTIKIRGHRPEILGAIIRLHGTAHDGNYKVYALDLNPDKTTTLYLNNMPPGVYSALKAQFEPIRPPDLTGTGAPIALSIWGKISGFESFDSVALYADGAYGPELGDSFIKDLGEVDINGGKAHYYLLTFSARHALPWDPCPSGSCSDQHYKALLDLQHPGAFTPSWAPYFKTLDKIRLNTTINGNTGQHRYFKVPGAPDLIPGQRFNVLILVHF